MRPDPGILRHLSACARARPLRAGEWHSPSRRENGVLGRRHGATPEGTIQPEFQERLRSVAEWLKVNGDSIYGSTYGPLQHLPFGRMTAKGKSLYLHVFDWPPGALQVEGLPPISAVRLLAGRQPLKFSQNGKQLRIEIPSQAPDPHVSVLELATN